MLRRFLGHSRPPLRAAAECFLELPAAPSTVVLPGGRAGRRFTELLIEAAGGAVRLPRIVTPGELPELLYLPKVTMAAPLERQCAWIAALQKLSDEERAVLYPYLRTTPRFPTYRGLAEELEQLSVELWGGLSSFELSIEALREAGSEEEIHRWELLTLLASNYLKELGRLGLADKHHERLRAVRDRAIASEERLYLIAVPELPKITEAMLQILSPELVEIWIAAGEEERHRFHETGTLNNDEWIKTGPTVQSGQVAVAKDFSEASKLVQEFLSQLGTSYRRDQVVLSVPDRRMLPYVRSTLANQGVELHNAEGQPIVSHPLCQTLRALVPYLTRPRAEDLSQLIRIPTIAAYLERAGSLNAQYLAQFDRWQRDHLPFDLSGELPERNLIAPLVDGLAELVAPLRGAEQELQDWAPKLAGLIGVLAQTQTDRELPAAHPARENRAGDSEVLELLYRELESWSKQARAPLGLTGGEAVQVLLSRMQQVGVPELPDRSALEQVGWLELPLDDAPVVVVAGVTEGQIPESADTDPYLPNALRMRLGLRDDAYRLARDLYVLHQLQSTKEAQHYIAARISPQQDPLVLSRILLMGERSTARGILANFYGVEGLQAPRSNGSAPPMPQQMALTLPATSRSAYSRVPEPTTFGGYAPPASIAVTDFRKYLRCPYTYFLERVLRASPVEPVPQELEPRQWGSALHEVLQRFGSGDYRESQDPLEIENVLLQEFDRLFDRKFGPGVVPAVFVQRAQVAARLRSFAKWQADWAAAGWKIVATERQFRPREVQLALSSGGSIGIHGTIDRIDRNQESGEFCVFDYKTGDTVQKPETAHLSRSRGWIDLQLPAYEYLVRTAGVVEAGTTVLLGYIPISGESIVKELLAKWSPEVLSSAHAAMQEIASKIEAGVFWPPKEGISPNHPIDALIFGGHFAS